jgi:anti-sigma factor RsiW
MTEERLAELMVRAVDGLLDKPQTEELMAYAAQHPDVADELRAHEALKQVTDGWVERLVADAREDGFAAAPVTRASMGVGLALLLAGVGVLFGVGAWELWLDPAAPLWVKAGSGLMLGGLLVLLTSVVRWKWATRNDPYNEVIR